MASTVEQILVWGLELRRSSSRSWPPSLLLPSFAIADGDLNSAAVLLFYRRGIAAKPSLSAGDCCENEVWVG
ncbi:unnamed protein product [Linum trigynum]|uniref:Uncharacterized protein n=1 Tax=Linum trigynum TaxID=586398 RepID=A0AAV2D9C6_9ROSI